MNNWPYDHMSLEEERRAKEEASYFAAVHNIEDWLKANRPELAEPITTLLNRLAA